MELMEKIEVKIRSNGKKQLVAIMEVWEEDDDGEQIMLKLHLNNKIYEGRCEDYFTSLQEIRKELEKEELQILCNGAAKNVYPSPMQYSMGNCLKAYKLYIGKSALREDIVNIFEYDERLEFVSVEKQFEYHEEWISFFKERS